MEIISKVTFKKLSLVHGYKSQELSKVDLLEPYTKLKLINFYKDIYIGFCLAQDYRKNMPEIKNISHTLIIMNI